MKTLATVAVLLALVLTASATFAEIGVIDKVPAATLLLPYFEVDTSNPNGISTLLSINNASATAFVAHVTLWTDQGIPTLNFDVYLTGFDVQTINLRDVFNGVLPRTADAGADPGDTISNKGPLSQDINKEPNPPNPLGPCGDSTTLYTLPLPAATIAHVRAAHTGQASAVFGGLCSGAKYGDAIARGSVTVDVVTACTLLFPSDPNYFSTVASFDNELWGDYLYVNPGQNFAQGDALVHVEACEPSLPGYRGRAGNGAGHCVFGAGAYTFYGRYVGTDGSDQREPLATTYGSRFVNGGGFDGGTDLLVWRDTKLAPTGTAGPYACTQDGPAAWFPLAQSEVVAFDEQETPTEQCATGGSTSPVTGGVKTCFPLAAQRIHTHGGNAIAADMTLPNFGWLYLNLNFALATDPYPGVAQAYVSTTMEAEGRFSVGFPAIQLDSAVNAVPGGTLLVP